MNIICSHHLQNIFSLEIGVMHYIKVYSVFLALEACLAIWLEEISTWLVVFDGDIFVHRLGSSADNLPIYIWCIAVK